MPDAPVEPPLALPEPRQIIQIAPPHRWAGCLATIQRVGDWGVTAFIALPHGDGQPPSPVYVRLKWEDFEPLFVIAPFKLEKESSP
jgi:hypothetical protein